MSGSEQESRNPEQDGRQLHPEQAAPTAEARPRILSQESVLTPDKIGDIREFAAGRADLAQARMAEAAQQKDAAGYNDEKEVVEARHKIATGLPVSEPEGPLNLEPYQAIAWAYQHENTPFDQEAFDAEAYHGVSPRLVQMELADLEAGLFAERTLLYGAMQEGKAVKKPAEIQEATTRSEMAQASIKHTLQLKAELEHIAKGGDMGDTPLAAERLQQRVEESRQRQKERDVRSARTKVDDAQESARHAGVEMPTDDDSRKRFVEEHFRNIELGKILDPETIENFSIYTDSVLEMMRQKQQRAPNPEAIRYPDSVASILGRSGPEVIYLLNAINMRLGEQRFSNAGEIGSLPFSEVLKQYLGLDVVRSHADYFKIFGKAV